MRAMRADALVYSTDKTLQEMGDRLDASSKSQAEQAVAALKQAMNGDDVGEIQPPHRGADAHIPCHDCFNV